MISKTAIKVSFFENVKHRSLILVVGYHKSIGNYQRSNVDYNLAEDGFTLIEVLIALVILGIALIPLLIAQARAVGDYGYANSAVYETVLAKNIMSNVFLRNEIYTMNKLEKISGAKGYRAKVSISKTSYPGIYMIKVTVFKKDRDAKSGVTLKSLTTF